MFHGGAFAKIVMVTVLLLGIFSLYLFFERFFFIKRLTSKTDSNFMNNIEDFIKAGKIEAAADYCKTQNSPEGRILEKGISRLGRPVSDIVSAMEAQAQVEVANMEKNLNLLAVVLLLNTFGLQKLISFSHLIIEVHTLTFKHSSLII